MTRDGVPQDARQEIKFVAYETEAASLMLWTRLNSAAFSPAYPSRWVNNIYFDTYVYDCFAQNLSGVSRRTKLRYRWYGESRYPAKGSLEVKRKRNQFGWKIRYQVSESAPYLGETWREILSAMRAQLPPEGKEWLNHFPAIVLINRYFRHYFLSADGSIRLTIDSCISVFDQRFNSSPNVTRRSNIPEITVMEFKFDRRDRDIANQVIQGLPLRLSRHSKYVTGLRAIAAG